MKINNILILTVFLILFSLFASAQNLKVYYLHDIYGNRTDRYIDVEPFSLKNDTIYNIKLPESKSVNEDLNKAISVYPNPSYGILNIEITNVDKMHYKFIDINSKIIKQGTCTIGSSELDITTFEPGLYFIYFYTEDRSSTYKIVKQ